MKVYAKAENVLEDITSMTDSSEDYLIRICEERNEVDRKIKELTETKKGYDEAIKNTLKEPKKVTYGDWHISYIETSTKRIDTKMIKEKYPEIAQECVSVSISTRLTVSHLT